MLWASASIVEGDTSETRTPRVTPVRADEVSAAIIERDASEIEHQGAFPVVLEMCGPEFFEYPTRPSPAQIDKSETRAWLEIFSGSPY